MIEFYNDGNTKCLFCKQLVDELDFINGVVAKNDCPYHGNVYHLTCYQKMYELKTKPLSVNSVWQGRRFKTQKYKDFERELLYNLPPLNVPEGKLILEICFYFSSKNSDIDNCCKPLIDVLQKKYGFNDRMIYELHVKKFIVPKGQEKFSFNFIPFFSDN